MSLIHLTAPTINVYICVITVSCLKSDLEVFNVAWQGGVVLSFYFPVSRMIVHVWRLMLHSQMC